MCAYCIRYYDNNDFCFCQRVFEESVRLVFYFDLRLMDLMS